MNAEGKYLPCEEYPNCPHCPMVLSDSPPTGRDGLGKGEICPHCGAIRMNLYDIETDHLEVYLSSAYLISSSCHLSHLPPSCVHLGSSDLL
jgi:hypothetical protein